jgi:hypothetical protein
LLYVGPIEQAQFRDFEAEIEVLTHTGANSGVYFHTAWQDSGWPTGARSTSGTLGGSRRHWPRLRGGALFVGVSAPAGKTKAIKDDAGVDRLVQRFGGQPLFLGLRADERGWATRISAKALSRIDFVLLEGETLAAALPTGAAADPNMYGDALVAATVSSLAQEPVDVYGAPLLPSVQIASRGLARARQPQGQHGGCDVHARPLRRRHAGRGLTAST